MSEDDLRLVEAALDNSSGARRRLARRLMDVIHREVVAVLRRHASGATRDVRQEARDMVQEVLMVLFERDAQELRRWDPERGRSLDSFVRLVARRKVARILGQRRGNPWADTPLDPQTIEDNARADAEACELGRQLEQRNELGAVLDRLYAHMSPRDHELFDLLFVQERDPAEVGELMGMTRQAVNAWSYRTRKLARKIILVDGQKSVSSPDAPPTTEKVRHGRR